MAPLVEKDLHTSPARRLANLRSNPSADRQKRNNRPSLSFQLVSQNQHHQSLQQPRSNSRPTERLMTLHNITNELKIIEGKISDYNRLAEYHPVKERIPPFKNIYAIRPTTSHKKSHPSVIGVIVYAMPLPLLKARNIATKNFFTKPKSKAERMHLINKYIKYIPRLIIDPRYRKLGLATWLLKTTLQRQTIPIVETLATYEDQNSPATQCGFERFFNFIPPRYSRLQATLKTHGIHEGIYDFPQIVNKRIELLSHKDTEHIEHEIRVFIKYFKGHKFMIPGIERTKFLLSKLKYPRYYLIRRNPRLALPC